MKKVLIFIVTITLFNALFAHEEPAKTLKEIKEKENNRLKIISNKTMQVSIWKYQIKDNKYNPDIKEKYIEMNYGQNGTLDEMKVFSTGNVLDYKTKIKYDDNFNMIEDTDYDPDGNIYEQIKYILDEKGRVKEQVNYTINNQIDSKFTYSIDYDKNIVLFEKFKPIDSIEYKIIYKYNGNPDTSNNVKIIKQSADGKQIMKVENIYENNLRIKKMIFNENDNLLYWFEYLYDDNENNIEIRKLDSSGNLLSKTVFSYNDKNQIISVEGYENAILKSYYSYEYKQYQ